MLLFIPKWLKSSAIVLLLALCFQFLPTAGIRTLANGQAGRLVPRLTEQLGFTSSDNPANGLFSLAFYFLLIMASAFCIVFSIIRIRRQQRRPQGSPEA